MNPVLKRSLTVGLAIGAVAALALALLLVFGYREPAYRGRSASAWGRDLNSPNPLVRSNAIEAIRVIGVEAAPVWERALSQEESRFKKPFLARAQKLAPWVRRGVVRFLKPFDPDMDRLAAARALEVLGSNAPVEPALRGLRVNDPQTASIAAATLGKIGRPAVPGLIASLADPDPGVRSLSLFALGTIGPQAEDAAPALVRLLSDNQTNNRPQIVFVLGRIGPPAVIPLLEALHSHDVQTRALAASAFGATGPMSSDVPPALILATQDPSPRVRLSAIEALGRVRPAAPDSVAAFTTALRDSESSVRLGALQSLARAWVRAAPAVPDLVTALEDANPEIRFHSALVLEHVGPGARAAVPALKARLQDNEASVRERAAAALKKIEPDPAPATPAIN